MNLDEWYLEYETLMQNHAAQIRKLMHELPLALCHTAQQMRALGLTATPDKPDVQGQEHLDLTPKLDEVG